MAEKDSRDGNHGVLSAEMMERTSTLFWFTCYFYPHKIVTINASDLTFPEKVS